MKLANFSGRGLVVLSAVFGAALVGTAALASRSLRERDSAVREGVLVRAGHELEARLRAATPDEAPRVVREFLEEHSDTVAGAAVVGPAGTLASAGENTAGAFEVAVALGREWRSAVLGSGAEAPPGRGAGPGPGFKGGRGPGGRGSPPIRLRLHATPAVGSESALARAVLAGGAAAAAALVGLAIVAARGLAERRRREEAEAESLRLATVARAGAGLAHRLRNPLAVVKGTAQLLAERVPGGDRERVERIVVASERMETILSRLLDFARPPAPQAASFDLASLAREVASRGGGAIVDAEGPVPAHADREHVETILEELLANARAFDPGGTAEVAVRRHGERALLEVLDRGAGLDLDPASAFEPYVTSRPDGTGLGLAIVRALAVANGGTAELAARPGGGCVASVSIPAGEA
ncbi:MAG: HAMP domain-containing histidine kinase [Thermoanaerobaculia bacterium]|nr:HAMP domain-containing histidine kinase [Thermoanaerobaculia bacterium]